MRLLVGLGSSGRPYHFSRDTTALSYAVRQSVRYSAKMKSGVSLPFSAEAELIADSIFFRRSFMFGLLSVVGWVWGWGIGFGVLLLGLRLVLVWD